MGPTLRVFRTDPRYAVTVVATLALGLGVATAAYSIVDRLLVEPLPYAAPDELVVVWPDRTGLGGTARSTLSRRTFAELRRLPSLASVEAQFSYYANIGETTLDQVVMASRVTPGFLDGLGIAPLLGRTVRDDDRGVAVLSYALWQSYFGGRPDVVGKSFRLEDVNPLLESGASASGRFTVIGVMPADFWGVALVVVVTLAATLPIVVRAGSANPAPVLRRD